MTIVPITLIIIFNIPPQTHDAAAISVESLLDKKRKHEIECDFVNKSASCIEEGTKGNVKVPLRK